MTNEEQISQGARTIKKYPATAERWRMTDTLHNDRKLRQAASQSQEKHLELSQGDIVQLLIS